VELRAEVEGKDSYREKLMSAQEGKEVSLQRRSERKEEREENHGEISKIKEYWNHFRYPEDQSLYSQRECCASCEVAFEGKIRRFLSLPSPLFLPSVLPVKFVMMAAVDHSESRFLLQNYLPV